MVGRQGLLLHYMCLHKDCRRALAKTARGTRTSSESVMPIQHQLCHTIFFVHEKARLLQTLQKQCSAQSILNERFRLSGRHLRQTKTGVELIGNTIAQAVLQ